MAKSILIIIFLDLIYCINYTIQLPIITNYVNLTQRDKRRHFSVCPFYVNSWIIHILYIPFIQLSMFKCCIHDTRILYACILYACIHLKSYIFEHNFKKLTYIYIIINVSKLDRWWLIS